MRYSIAQLAAFTIMSIAITAIVLFGISHGLEPVLVRLSLSDLARAMHAFFFERSVIQWCTLCVFFLSIVLLVSRSMHQSAVRRSLLTLASLDLRTSQLSGDLARLVRERIEKVKRCESEHGRSATYTYAQELALRDDDHMEQIYSLLGSAVQVMLALGFFGTVWGISRSMFGSFTQLSGTISGEQIRAGLQGFTAALSTALDTTVLGLVCGILTSIAVTAMRWAEVGGLNELTEMVREKFDLKVQASPKEAGAEQVSALVMEAAVQVRSVAGQATEALREELSRLTDQTLADLRDRLRLSQDQAAQELSQITASTALALQKEAELVTRQISETREQFDRSLGEAQTAFDAGLAEATTCLDEHGKMIVRGISQEIEKVEQAMRRVPVISIRYPHTASEQQVSLQDQKTPAPDRETDFQV